MFTHYPHWEAPEDVGPWNALVAAGGGAVGPRMNLAAQLVIGQVCVRVKGVEALEQLHGDFGARVLGQRQGLVENS